MQGAALVFDQVVPTIPSVEWVWFEPCSTGMLGDGGATGKHVLQSTFGPLITRGRVAREASRRARAQAGALGDLFRSLRERMTPAATPAAWVQTDGRGIIRAADDAAARLFNVTLQRLLGTPLLHFVARRDARLFRGMVKLLRYPQAIHDAIVRMRARHASTFLLSVKVRALGRDQYRWSFAEAARPQDPGGRA